MHEPWVERVIREAQDAGKLDVNEGAGEPIAGLARPYDSAWWAKRWLAAERARQTADDVQRSIDSDVPRLLSLTVTGDTRTGLESLNAKIQAHNETSPGNSLPLLDVGQLMKERDQRRRD